MGMMIAYTEKLKYAGITDVYEFGFGLKSYMNIYDIYNCSSVRDKVICRACMLDYLKDYFSESTLIEYGEVIFMLCTRQVEDVNTISNCLIELMEKDPIFENKLKEIYATMDKENISFGDAILNSIAGVLSGKEDYFRSYFRHKKEFVICVSDGWLYFSVQDENKPIDFPKDIRVEVLSYAKNWTGEFNRL